MQPDVITEKTGVGISLNPSKIMQTGMGFWASKAFLAAVRFELFTLLSPQALGEKQIKEKLQLQCSDRHVFDWLDVLVSLGFLERKGLLENAQYTNAEDTDFFLDKRKRSYMGGILEMANNRLYQHWSHLEEGLLTGAPQNEGRAHPSGNMEFFAELYKDPEKLQEFMDAMSGIQTGNFITLTNTFDFGPFQTMLDIGGADGWLSIQVCLHHPHIHCSSFDLPPVEPLAKKKIASFNLSDRIHTISGDFIRDEWPKADLITMGNILHGLDEASKLKMLEKAYKALPPKGACMIIENIIDNERKQNTFGMLMSLNMLIENGEAFDCTMKDFEKWAKAAGFTRTEHLHLQGPTSAAIAYK